jgi:hypothetical protein
LDDVGGDISPIPDIFACSSVNAVRYICSVIITDYFASIERGLEQNSSVVKVDEPLAYLTSDDYNGLLRC